MNSTTNPYGLDALLQQGDPVSLTVLLILVLMSTGSWYVIVARLLSQARWFALARNARLAADQAASPAHLARVLPATSPFHALTQAGLVAAQQHAGFGGRVDFSDWIELSLQRASERLLRELQPGLSLLATIGSSAPFVGLFGTVWGIYHALTAIGLAGQASIDKVAGPVGEALIMTALGLAVAVPAVLGYNGLLRRNTALMEAVRDFSDALHAALLGAPAPEPAARPALHVTA